MMDPRPLGSALQVFLRHYFRYSFMFLPILTFYFKYKSTWISQFWFLTRYMLVDPELSAVQYFLSIFAFPCASEVHRSSSMHMWHLPHSLPLCTGGIFPILFLSVQLASSPFSSSLHRWHLPYFLPLCTGGIFPIPFLSSQEATY